MTASGSRPRRSPPRRQRKACTVRPVDPVRLAPAACARRDGALKEAGLDDVPVVVGGIIPPEDAGALKEAGVAEVYTPKDFELNRIMTDLCASSKVARRQQRRMRRNESVSLAGRK